MAECGFAGETRRCRSSSADISADVEISASGAAGDSELFHSGVERTPIHSGSAPEPRSAGCEHPMEADQTEPRTGNQRGESLHERHRIEPRYGRSLDAPAARATRDERTGSLGTNGSCAYRTRAIPPAPDRGERAINAEKNLTHGRPQRPLVLVRDAGPASRSISRYRNEPLRAGARRWGPDRSRCPCAAPTPCAPWDA